MLRAHFLMFFDTVFGQKLSLKIHKEFECRNAKMLSGNFRLDYVRLRESSSDFFRITFEQGNK